MGSTDCHRSADSAQPKCESRWSTACDCPELRWSRNAEPEYWRLCRQCRIAVAKSLGLYRQCSGEKDVWGGGTRPRRSIADTVICTEPAMGIQSQADASKGVEGRRERGSATNRHRPSFYSRASGLVQNPFPPRNHLSADTKPRSRERR